MKSKNLKIAILAMIIIGAVTVSCKDDKTYDLTPSNSVQLDKSTLTMDMGSKTTLVATIDPPSTSNRDLSWTSSATGVATVANDGTVTAVGAGTTTITATSGGKMGTCEVTVTRVAATGITLDVGVAKTVWMGDGSVKVTATITPVNATDRVVWSSADGTALAAPNKGIGTVKQPYEDGAYTAYTNEATFTIVKPGATGAVKLYAAVGDEKDSCVVTITPVSITLDMLFTTVDMGSTVSLTEATNNATVAQIGKAKWDSDTKAVAVVAGGTVTGTDPGVAGITYTVNGQAANCLVVVKPLPAQYPDKDFTSVVGDAENGESVTLPLGNHTGALVLADGVTVTGSGLGTVVTGTVVMGKNTVLKNLTLISDVPVTAGSGSTIDGVVFLSKNGGTAATGTAVTFAEATGVTVQNCRFAGYTKALDLSGAANIQILNNEFNGMTPFTITAADASFAAWNASKTTGMNFTGNKFYRGVDQEVNIPQFTAAKNPGSDASKWSGGMKAVVNALVANTWTIQYDATNGIQTLVNVKINGNSVSSTLE